MIDKNSYFIADKQLFYQYRFDMLCSTTLKNKKSQVCDMTLQL